MRRNSWWWIALSAGSRSLELISVIVVCEWLRAMRRKVLKWRWCRLLGCPSNLGGRILVQERLEDQVGHCDVDEA